ncbi:hypothetical protein ASZ90_005307 [hydrocarbon metagenome]|uniref:Bulb-type lectin domain-containing protein n=1 Tax=hydrocarbon metagenome TaxID=938273 RepID=A0A0W8FVH6_9ZZZZ
MDLSNINPAKSLIALFVFLIIQLPAFSQQLVITPDPIYMGKIPIASNAQREVLIINSSAQTANITSISITGTDVSYFSIPNNPGSANLDPLQRLYIDVEYNPQITGEHHAQLIIQGNFGSHTINITGYGSSVTPMITFERILGTSESESAASVKETHDGYIMTGFYKPDDEDYSYLLVKKTDLYGKTVWFKTFGTDRDPDGGSDVIVANDGNYVVLGNTESYGAGRIDFYLLKLDPNGNLIWSKTYGGQYDESASEVLQTSDGGFIMCGNTKLSASGSRDAYIVRVDAQGNQLWAKNYGGAGGETASGIIETSDGGYIFSGSTTSNGTDDFQLWIVKIDANGNEVWSKTHGGAEWEEAASISPTSDGGYILSGYTLSKGAGAKDAYLIKVNATGDVIWDKVFGDIHADEFRDAKETPDGGFIAVGYSITFFSQQNQYRDLFIVKTNSSGDLVWSKLIGSDKNEGASSVRITTDGGFVISGFTDSYSKSNNIYLLKFNAAGEITSVYEDDEEKLLQSFILNQNYPNPFNGQTTITFVINKPNDISLILYDLLGREIKILKQGWYNPGEYSATIDSEYLSSGIYFYSLRAGSNIQTRKMTLIR